jgi:hypothetical protein
MKDFQELVDAWLDGELDESEVRRLNDRLTESDADLREFAAQVNLHCLLRSDHVLESSLAIAVTTSADVNDADARQRVSGSRKHLLWGGLGLVVSVAVLLGVAWVLRQPHRLDVASPTAASRKQDAATDDTTPSATDRAFVDPLATIDAVSLPQGPSYSAGTRLKAGNRLRFTEGEINLRFAAGANVLLRGPADLELTSRLHAVLHRGQLTARVEKEAHGFTVATPFADVIDLGTVFGVTANASGQTDIVVFEGEIEIDPRENSPAPGAASGRRLTMGEAARIQPDGQRVRIPMIWRDPADSRWSTGASSPRRSLIAAVRDNLATSSRPKFYAIVPGGFGEDAKAYVDRIHEWNGFDEQGLPDELMGGDYIRTFNDDKFRDDVEVVVTLSRPATVYVLFYDGLPVPEWLSSGFVNTGLYVGMDDGDYRASGGNIVPRPLGVDAGQSIDCRFSVWKREVRRPSEVHLGPICHAEDREMLPDFAMYGIVAVPLSVSDTPSSGSCR